MLVMSNEEPSTRRRRASRNGAGASAGMQFLSAVIASGSARELDVFNHNHFSGDDEVSAYRFIKEHLTRYGALPSESAVAQNGILLPTTEDTIRYYADRLVNRAVYTAVEDGFDNFSAAMSSRDSMAILAALRGMLDNASVVGQSTQFTELSFELDRFADRYTQLKNNPLSRYGIPTGFPTVDRETYGLYAGDLATVVARPGVGKTYKMLKMMKAAADARKRCLILSMEMTTEQVIDRYVGLHTGINPQNFRRGELCHWSEQYVMQELSGISGNNNIHFLSGNGIRTADHVEQGIRQIAPDVVYVDAAYLMKTRTGRTIPSKWERLAEVMQDLKSLTISHNIPIVMSVQFNREVKQNLRASKNGSSNIENLDVGSIAGTDEIGQLSSLVTAIQIPADKELHNIREGRIIKNREGSQVSYKYHQDFGHRLRIEEFTQEEYEAFSEEHEGGSDADSF